MLFKNAELFNIVDMSPAADGRGGYDLFRLPPEVREKADEGLRVRTSHFTCGAEIRFVINSGTAKVTLRTAAAIPTDPAPKYGQIVTYYGGVQANWQTALYRYTDEPTTLEIAPPPTPDKLEKLTVLNGYPYSPQVVRLCLNNSPAVLIDIEGDIRPPEEEEVPVLRGLMYGSSITHGSLALVANNFIPAVVGRRLRADICNLGFAGCCHLEKSVADYIVSRTDCDFFFSELGINVIGYMDAEEFERRVRYYINTAASAHAGKYFIVTDLYYCRRDLEGDEKAAQFREIVRRACEESECANVHYICGLDLLTSSAGLSADLVHPNVDGMAEISVNLSEKLKEIMGM
ncbi:MAG: hypothetical protein E7662_07840 [Ruminococcaceae bacterium]|nr:hypothetical protein [Oscillospiraceae bacterium]